MSVVSNTDVSVNDKESSSNVDFIWGAAAIGREIGRTPRQAYHLLSRGRIKSARQVGKNYCAHKLTLRKEFGAE
jgi:hypothetical protein